MLRSEKEGYREYCDDERRRATPQTAVRRPRGDAERFFPNAARCGSSGEKGDSRPGRSLLSPENQPRWGLSVRGEKGDSRPGRSLLSPENQPRWGLSVGRSLLSPENQPRWGLSRSENQPRWGLSSLPKTNPGGGSRSGAFGREGALPRGGGSRSGALSRGGAPARWGLSREGALPRGGGSRSGALSRGGAAARWGRCREVGALSRGESLLENLSSGFEDHLDGGLGALLNRCHSEEFRRSGRHHGAHLERE
jgi:hypothetical protein